jgi:hypothetical protein
MHFTTTLSIIAMMLSLPAYAAPTLAKMTGEQLSSLQDNLIAKSKDRDTIEAASQAKDVIFQVLAFESCLTNYDGSALNRYSAPGVSIPNMNYFPVMMSTKKHIRDSCLSVIKIQGWKLLAKNSLVAEVTFSADDSGEVTKKGYEFQRQFDGSWQYKGREDNPRYW